MEGGSAPGFESPAGPDARAAVPAPLFADPLHVDEDAAPVPPRPVVALRDDSGRSPDPSVCPFLRRDFGGTLVAPAGVPGMEQTCIAVGDPRPQSLRQQELVCLRAAHADCPRYLRGAAAAATSSSRALPAVPRATVAALLILVLSAGLSFGFVVQRGGIAMPVVGESPTAVAEVGTPAADPPAATVAPAAAGSPTPDPLAATGAPATAEAPASPAIDPSPTQAPTPAPSSPIALDPTAAPTPNATPKSDRYKLLEPCTDRKKCYVYVVRSGDNLFSIARYFGHSMATIYAWNPQYPETRLRAGAQIRMPPPTR